MKILVALDGKEYGRGIVKDVTRLAENTLADIVLLAVQDNMTEPSQLVQMTLKKYQQDIYSYFRPEELPYGDFSSQQWQEKSKGDWSISTKGLKEFTLRIRGGSVAKEVVNVAKEMECDLIILGCNSEFGCEWDGEMNVPLRIAEDAPCSVLVVKQSRNSNQIVSILDQSVVNQDAMEMVNQLVTLHDASLKIIGVKEKNPDKKDEIEKRMVQLLKYYNDREVNAWLKVIDSDSVTEYVTNSSHKAIIALWMGGKQSLIKRIFSQSMVDKLLTTSQSSLFILR